MCSIFLLQKLSLPGFMLGSFYLNYNVITSLAKSGSLGLSTRRFWSFSVFPFFLVLLSIVVFDLSDFDGSFSVFKELLSDFQFKCDSVTEYCIFAFYSVPVLLFLSLDRYNGTASGADRKITSNHVITFQNFKLLQLLFPPNTYYLSSPVAQTSLTK